MTSPFPFTLRDDHAFDRFVLRAVLCAAAAGLAHAALRGFHHGLPAWLMAAPAVLVLAPKASVSMRMGIAAPVVMGVFGALVFGVDDSTPVIVGAGTGVGLFVARWSTAEGAAAPKGAHAAAVVVLGAVLAPLGEWVTRTLWSVRPPVFDFGMDVLLVAVDGFLLAVIAFPLHVHPRGDLLQEQAEETVRTLRGRFRTIGEKVAEHYQECRALIAALPRDKALIELEATFQEAMRSTLEHLRAWSGVDADLAEAAAAPHLTELERLRAELDAAADPVAKQHLEVAVSMMQEEVERLSVLAQQRRRAIARLEAQAALLHRVKGALLGVKSGHAEVRAVELTALARKLSAQSASHSLEGELMREVASGAEIDQLAAGVR